ncbi:MAG: cell division protein FtsL [Spirochaetaceae bacterium]|jgi:cell division protein FtsL|nr:cell division protein FtsL [Spirochaetaceae bacterium]
MSGRFFLYAMAISIPLSLGAAVWQTARYAALKQEVRILLEQQEEWIDNNKRLITDIAVLSSSARIENFAKTNLSLEKKDPEDVLQVIIENE